jgi:hypothetical protein
MNAAVVSVFWSDLPHERLQNNPWGASMHDQIVVRVLIDGLWRAIYEQPDGRRYLLDDDDERVYNVWHFLNEKMQPKPGVVVEAHDVYD